LDTEDKINCRSLLAHRNLFPLKILSLLLAGSVAPYFLSFLSHLLFAWP
jgi:hypothetical protein